MSTAAAVARTWCPRCWPGIARRCGSSISAVHSRAMPTCGRSRPTPTNCAIASMPSTLAMRCLRRAEGAAAARRGAGAATTRSGRQHAARRPPPSGTLARCRHGAGTGQSRRPTIAQALRPRSRPPVHSSSIIAGLWPTRPAASSNCARPHLLSHRSLAASAPTERRPVRRRPAPVRERRPSPGLPLLTGSPNLQSQPCTTDRSGPPRRQPGEASPRSVPVSSLSAWDRQDLPALLAHRGLRCGAAAGGSACPRSSDRVHTQRDRQRVGCRGRTAEHA